MHTTKSSVPHLNTVRRKKLPRIIITRLCKKRSRADTTAGRGVTSITFMARDEFALPAPAGASAGYFQAVIHDDFLLQIRQDYLHRFEGKDDAL